MAWRLALGKCAIIMLLILFSVRMQLSAAVTVQAALTIQPSSAITDDKITLECKRQRDVQNLGGVYYVIKRDKMVFLKSDVACDANIVKTSDTSGCPSCNLDITTTCSSLIVRNLVAQRKFAGTYKCEAEDIKKDYSRDDWSTEEVVLSVGDKTPPVDQFVVKDLANGRSFDDGDTVPAGTNTTVTCETNAVIPEPGFVVSISGRENRTNLTIGHRISFHESVPREPTVDYLCEVFNGFGAKQFKKISIKTTYGGIASEVRMPKEVPIQMETDIEICAIRNHPSKEIQVSGLDPAMVQSNYPILKQEFGMSYAYVRLSPKAAEVKDAKLEYGCSVGDMPPVKGSVLLVGSNMAMMTAGIVILTILAFLLIVAGIAYALKRRSASARPQ